MKFIQLFLITPFLFSGFSLSAQTRTYAPKNPDNWKILSMNSDTGEQLYFNTDLIWKKDSLYTCKVKFETDPINAKGYKAAYKGRYNYDAVVKDYAHSVYYLVLSPVTKSVKIYGLSHVDDSRTEREIILWPNDSIKPLSKLDKEGISRNVLYFIRMMPIDESVASPF